MKLTTCQKKDVVLAILYMHQISGTFANVYICDCIYQKEKTGASGRMGKTWWYRMHVIV